MRSETWAKRPRSVVVELRVCMGAGAALAAARAVIRAEVVVVVVVFAEESLALAIPKNLKAKPRKNSPSYAESRPSDNWKRSRAGCKRSPTYKWLALTATSDHTGVA